LTRIKLLFLTLPTLALACWLSILLTQQRIQAESQNIQFNQNNNQTQYVWKFEQKKQDIVESFKKFWNQSNPSQIEAHKASNPKLSLNLSGSVINSLQYRTLVIESDQELNGFVTIEFKTELDDDLFYYSPKIKLFGKNQSIDLQTTWRGLNRDKSKIIKAAWGTSKQKVSSLVLHFENSQNDISIKTIRMPRVNTNISSALIDIDCDAHIDKTTAINPMSFNHFILNETCLLSSNYMWLKHTVYQSYPGSTLNLSKTESLSGVKQHLVNQSYTSILYINSILYVFISLVLILVFKVRNTYMIQAPITESWYQWLFKKTLLQKLLPFNFIFSYSVILAPTLILFMLMMSIKFPTLTAFSELPMYFLWAILQQFILGYILAERIFYNRIQDKFIASILAGLVFALFHMPSTSLMIATFIGGSCWALAWLWFKRFIPLAISHALLALMFYYVTPKQYLYSAKVLQWFWE
jgi:hypothetical protein